MRIPTSGPAIDPAVVTHLERALSRGEGKLPLPGAGHTAARWSALTRACRTNLSAGRLLEAHVDADAILAETGHSRVGAGELWGVWASEPPRPLLDAERERDAWILHGEKTWCSGASLCTHALVTARADGTSRLFAVDLRVPGAEPGHGGWRNAGMAGTNTESVAFDGVPARPVGAARDYLDRPGFWHGACGVAACWCGGALSVAEPLSERARSGRADPHQLAHLGGVDAALAAGRWALGSAAAGVEAPPGAQPADRRRAQRLRAVIERTATEVVDRVGRALGAAPLATDGAHARAVADLLVYLRQSHAERDLQALGEIAGAEPFPDGPYDG